MEKLLLFVGILLSFLIGFCIGISYCILVIRGLL